MISLLGDRCRPASVGFMYVCMWQCPARICGCYPGTNTDIEPGWLAGWLLCRHQAPQVRTAITALPFLLTAISLCFVDFALLWFRFGLVRFGLVWFGLTVANGSVGFATFWLMQLAWKKTFTSTYLGNCVCVCLLVSAEKYLPYTLALAKRSQRWKSSWRTLAAM